MIALVEGYRAGLYARHQWLPNIIAGLVVGIVALPLSMAFAIASGARPEQGIYTAIIGGGLVTLLGGSRLQIAGPTGAFIVILSGITAKYGMAGLQVATLMAGVMLLLMGLTKMGGVIKFIPTPVIVGFTTGIGVIIFVGQWSDFLGLPKVSAEHFHEKLWGQLTQLSQTHLPTLAIALLSLLIVIFSPKVAALKKVPGPLVAMIVATLLQSTLHLQGVATIGTAFGGVPQGLPEFALPDLSVSQVLSLIGPAFTIAMLGAIESLLSAVVADGMAGTKHDSNQELVGQGIANMVTPLFGGFAATGAIARTATNIRNGATSPIAGVMHAVTLIAVLLVLAPLASSIPLAALAAILFVVAWNMSEVPHFVRLLMRAPYADRAILLVTFLLTVFVDLVVAVNVGVILAILHFLRRMAAAVELRQLDHVSVQAELSSQGIAALPVGTLLYEVDGPMFFGAVDNFERVLRETATDPKILIIRLQRVPFIDATGLQCLEDAISDLQKRGIKVLLCEANERVLQKLKKAGVFEILPPAYYFESLPGALLIASQQA
ncbi:MAG: SulP family inorganic anion transporter [Alcaligenaceae bacterium]